MALSPLDIQAPFDPTALSQLTAAQLLQLISGAFPFSDKGLVGMTIDVAGNPQVPNAVGTPKWQNYIWLRISPTTNSASLYIWNPNAASDATFLQWQTAFSASIGPASIQGYQIAANTITDGNIANLNYSKLIGAPTGLPPSGAAGGILTGTYPNPQLGGGVVGTSNMAQNSVTGGLTGIMATGVAGATLANNIAIPASSTLGSPTGGSAGAPASNDRVVVNSTGTAYVTIRKVLDALVEPAIGQANQFVQVNNAGNGFQYASAIAITAPVVGNANEFVVVNNAGTGFTYGPSPTTNALKLVQVNAGETGFQYAAIVNVQNAFASTTTSTSSSGNITDSAAHATTDTGMTAATGLTVGITPSSNTNFLIVRAIVCMKLPATQNGCWMYVFNTANTAVPIAACRINTPANVAMTQIMTVSAKVTSPGTSALTFAIYFGQVSPNACTVNNFAETSSIEVSEYSQ